MKCPITGKNCTKHKAFESEGNLVCEDCLHKGQKPIHSVGDTICNSCKISLAEVVKGSRLGCAHCYDNFSETMPHIIASVQMGHSGMMHVGKVPRSFLENKSKSISYEEIREEIVMRMNAASSKQEYQEAAKMMSKINELDSIVSQKNKGVDDQLPRFILNFWDEISKSID